MQPEQVAAISHNQFVAAGYFNKFTRSSDLLPLIFGGAESYYYLDRKTADQDSRYKQLIPYFFLTRIRFGRRYYLAYTRGKSGGEERLHLKQSIGFGGHMNPGEVVDSCVVREMNEEVPGALPYDRNFIGFLNNDSDPVGKVHLGIVFEVFVDDNFKMEFPDSSIYQPEWKTFDELVERFIGFEEWSKYLIELVLTK